MRWSDSCTTYEKDLRTASGASVFGSELEHGNKRWADLKIRTVEHVCLTLVIGITLNNASD